MDLDPKKRVQTAALAQGEIEAVLAAIESGDLKRYDEELSEKEAQAYSSLMTKNEEGRGKTVLLIESNVKVQDNLRDRLKDLGYRVLITGNPERGLERFNDLDPLEDSPVDCVIFSSAGLGKEAISWFEKFLSGSYTAQIPAILVVTGNLGKLVHQEWFNDKRAMLNLPVKFKHIQKKLRELLNIDMESLAAKISETFGAEPLAPVEDDVQDTDVELG